MASITTWHRLTPLSRRSRDYETALAAEIHDPLWFLARQRQTGEMRGEDTGSPAFVRIAYKAAPLTEAILTPRDGEAITVPLDDVKPFEAQILAEPHPDDFGMRAELGVTFFNILDEAFGRQAAQPIKSALLLAAEVALEMPEPVDTDFDPIDDGSRAFKRLTLGKTIDGVKVYGLAKQEPPSIPDPVPAALAGQEATLLNAYAAFVLWVDQTFGPIGPTDPQGWNPSRLEYDVKLRFGPESPMTVKVHPNETGAVDWSSFDIETPSALPFDALPETVAHEIPTHVRFPGMPAPRFWDFESADLPWPDIDVAPPELARLMVVDFAMLYGVDWFVVPLTLEVGHAVQVASLVVYDVFDGRTVIDRIEEDRNQEPPDRFTLFSTAAPGGAVGNFMVLPPLAGSALQHGTPLEEVRFARDEVANMAWGIEAVTSSRIGERRRGVERDTAVDAAAPPVGPLPSTTAPLRYRVASKVSAHWIPLVVPDEPNPTSLEKAASLQLLAEGPQPVPALGKIMNPTGLTNYRIFDEEVPKVGARVERVVYRSRSHDGKSYLWVARRKRPGSGETQSGLRFDAALPTET
jgi:hypothetical protein